MIPRGPAAGASGPAAPTRHNNDNDNNNIHIYIYIYIYIYIIIISCISITIIIIIIMPSSHPRPTLNKRNTCKINMRNKQRQYVTDAAISNNFQ